MFENEVVNLLSGGIVAILIPALIAIKFLDWLFGLDTNNDLEHENITIHKRLAKRPNLRLKKTSNIHKLNKLNR